MIDADRKSMRYRSTRDDDTDLREKLRELANQRRRFGYRRLHILLRQEGGMINRKKTQRLYKEEAWRLLLFWPCQTSAGAWSWAQAPFIASLRICARPDGLRPAVPGARRGR